MKVKSLYIEQFGCLKDKRVEFEDGLNIISLPNESGKSTIAEFIRVMLYGVNSLRFNQRKQYMPFGHATMGGELTVEHQGTEYIIRRTFGNRKSDDKIEVVNALTFTPVKEYCKDNVGEIMCGISGDTYENTCYIRQLCAGIDETKSAEIQTRLMNLAQNASEDYSYKSAVAILDSAIRDLTKPRGKINEVQAKINELILKRNEKQKIKDEYEACQRRLADLKSNKTKDVTSYHLVRASYLPAILSLFLLFVLKPLVVALIFAVLLVPAVMLSVKTKHQRADLMEYSRQVGYFESRLESLRQEFNKIDISQLEGLRRQLDGYNGAVSDLNYAKQKLAEAFEEMQQDYVPRLNGNATAIFKKLTDGRYTEFMADDSYKITVRDGEGRLVPGEYLSKGTYDQIYFALRMSLVGMIAEDMPIVLDDAFALYDDVRLKKALQYLKTHKNQIIILSCQNRESEIIKEDN